MRRFSFAATFAALALLSAACASNKATGLPSGPTEEPTSAACPTIEMTDTLKFEPAECTVAVGAPVVWRSGPAVAHTVTAEPDAPVQFDSGQVDAGGEFTFTFQTAGEVPYYCKLHAAAGARQGMVGTITVEAA